jgi:subtilisin family serine protease
MEMTKRAALVGLVAVAIALLSHSGSAQQRGVSIPVIVVFEDATDFSGFAGFYRADDRAQDNAAAWNYLDRGVAGFVQELERGRGFRADHVYSRALKGFAARLTAQQIADLENDARVAYVELDGTMEIVGQGQGQGPGQGRKGGGGGGGTPTQTLPWGIERIGADDSSTKAGNGSGTVGTVRAYIIDTGIDGAHADLTVADHVNFAGGSNTDCNGHGTHVAGTVAAEDNTQDVVGVAPGAALYGVKVLGCSGSGSTSGVIKGIDWVTQNADAPAIANMSLGGSASLALDDAVRNSAAAGVFYSIAAGNSGADACTQSPARAGAGTNNGIMTTAATDNQEREASWSNDGGCVDVWAPGVSILSTKRGGGTTTLSGTSMAAPHVGGGAALYLSKNATASPSQVEGALRSAAVSTGTDSKDGTPIWRLNVAGF